MRRTLAAMSQESKPEKFLEHVLSTIGHQLDSDSVGVYELNPATGRVHLVADCCQGQLHLAPAARIQASEPLSIASSVHPVWTEFFHTGSRVVLGQIEPNTVRVRFADGDVHGLTNSGEQPFVYLSVTSPPIDFSYAYAKG